MDHIKIIAIDGTAASGKGTLARRLGTHLDYAVLDTGLLYRRVALTLILDGVSLDDADAAIHAAQTIDADSLNDDRLRSAEAGRGASVMGAIPEVRQALLDFQRNFPKNCGKAGAILDGRDIGTVIFPDADIKFYVDADQAIRAERRHKELVAKGDPIKLETVLHDFKIRDSRDAKRQNAPMIAAPDAVMIDTTSMGPDDVFELALKEVQKHF